MNSSARDLKSPESPHATLHGRAMENLRYIRTTMERSESYTHVSGMGVAATGVVALIAWSFAITASSDLVWLAVWLEAAAASLALAVYTLARKSRTEGRAVLRERGRRFAWTIVPPMTAGAVLTLALVRLGATELLPGTWLLLYGTSFVTGGSTSVRSLPLMGSAFMLTGALALLTPPTWGDAWMAVGFGGLHILFGINIWRSHGG